MCARSRARSRPAGGSSCTATTTSTACAPPRSASRCCACSAPRWRRSCPIASSTATAWPSRASRRLARAGAGLLLTVDCGIAAPEAVARARELGLDVVVTDHHRPGDVLPDAPIVASRTPSGAAYPFADLCGTGVVLKLAQALWSRRHGGDPAALPPALDRLSDLVALATVADVVPLADENRALVRRGMRRLAEAEQARGCGRSWRVAGVDPARAPRHPTSASASRRASTPPAGSAIPRSRSTCCSRAARSDAQPLAEQIEGRNRRAPGGRGHDPARRGAPRSSAAERCSAAIACSSPRARAGTRA